MSEIDIQNAKQIRDPMDVLIEMELASDDVTLSYSGYSGTAKVADGELDEPTWPMRKLADLQGDGFPLDGSCVLYNASTSPSQANGKLGVRGNVGEAVTITITGNKSIASLFIFATGAESVTFGGTTTPIYNNVVTIPVGATSITITLNPASETTRIEVSQIEAGAKFRITNENLIRATVSLRSDLSIIDPTLPESEINIEVYQDTDISEAVASIPEDTPIMYSAGYEGDMSPVRRFYVTGQVTWADNVLSIHGVDAVHFLEKQLPSAVYMNDSYDLRDTLQWMLTDAGIAFQSETIRKNYSAYHRVIIFERQSYRDFIKHTQWLLNIPGEGINLYPAYIDAGIPRVRYRLPQAQWTIQEEDCGECKKDVERAYTGAIYNSFNHNFTDFDIYGAVGTYDWYKNNGLFLNIDENTINWMPALTNEEWKRASRYGIWSSSGASAIAPADTLGSSSESLRGALATNNGATMIYDNAIQERRVANRYGVAYTQIVPWNCYYRPGAFDHPYWGNIRSMADMWRYLTDIEIFDSGLSNFSGTLWGTKLQKQPETIEINAETENILRLDVDAVWGQAYDDPDTVRLFPNKGIEWLLGRSPITGSFTWKGDPRMQPRDVVEWERLDGTTTTITLENITLTHEGGGTSAEITYREGVV